MKTGLSVLFIFFFYQFLPAQENIYIDENGLIISQEAYHTKRSSKDGSYTFWIHIDTNGDRHYTLKEDLYLKGNLKYTKLKAALETMTNRKIPDSNSILISYRYKDDLCTPRWDNKWTRQKIADRKNFLNPLRTAIEQKNITYFVLFENGISLKNRPHKKDEYFFKDSADFLRNKLFKSPTWCGSYALIKPNSEILVRNGEYRPDWMADHASNENWSLFFTASQNND